MNEAVVRTVNGDVPASELGACYAHEHVLVDGGALAYANDEYLLSDRRRARSELRAARLAGLRSMVDATPCGFGRNVIELARISDQTGIHVVAATGLHLASSYVRRHWISEYSARQLEELFLADVEIGIDRHDYVGPFVRRVPHRAGVIKVASAGTSLTSVEKRVFSAAARASRRSGAPLLTHTDGPACGAAQVEFLTRAGVVPDRIVLSHLDRSKDVKAIADLAALGVFVELDQAPRDADATLRVVLELLDAGCGAQILLGMDMGRRRYWQAYGGWPGLAFLIETFSARLRSSGSSADEVHRLLVDNPARAFALRPAARGASTHPHQDAAMVTAQ